MGPLLIEIERSPSDKLGLVLSNSCPNVYQQTLDVTNGKMDEIAQAGVFIANIIPATLADRTGALSIGDKIQSVDDTLVENTSLSPEDVMQLLDTNTDRGFTQIQILPAHAIARLRGKSLVAKLRLIDLPIFANFHPPTLEIVTLLSAFLSHNSLTMLLLIFLLLNLWLMAYTIMVECLKKTFYN